MKISFSVRGFSPSNNVLALRHLCALCVLYGHSFDLTGAPADADLVARWLPGFKAGSLGVLVFFSLSGFLLMASLIERPQLGRYLRHRALRLLPGYWISLLACALLLGPLFTRMPILEYFQHPLTWQYLSDNALPLSFAWTLPGVFEALPFPQVVNGSLWSLGLELRWYAYLALLLALGVAQRRGPFTVVAVVFLLVALSEVVAGRPDPLHYRTLSCAFVGGALWAHWRSLHAPDHRGLLALLALLALTGLGAGTPAAGAVQACLVFYASFWVAYALPALPWPPQRDYSYGLYLYGFPVQQSLLALYPGLAPLQLFAAAGVCTLVLAWCSWHAIEKPALGLRAGPRHARAAAPRLASGTA